MIIENKKLLLIINPVAGKTNVDVLSTTISAWAKRNLWQLRFHVTTQDENLSEQLDLILGEEAATGIPVGVIGVAGGDGTDSDVINAMRNIDLPLLLLSTGSTNIFALSLGIPADPERSLNLLCGESDLRRIDLMMINDRCRMMNAGVGFSSNLILNTTREQKRKFGVFAYFRNISRSIRMMRQSNFELTIDGVRESIHAAEVFIMNVGPGITDWINNDEFRPDDGVISVYVLRPSTMWAGMVILRNIIFGRKREKEIVCHYLVRNELRVECDRDLTAQADGEIIGTTPLCIRVLPQAVSLIVPVIHGIYIPIDYVNKYILGL